MARGINKVILIGNLGQRPRDPLPAQRGSRRERHHRHQRELEGQAAARTGAHRVAQRGVLRARLAEIAGEYLRKGSQVYVEGSLRTRKWQDKNGMDRYTTEIVARDMQMLGGRSGAGAGPGPVEPSQERPQERQDAQTPPASAKDEEFDDDIPF